MEYDEYQIGDRVRCLSDNNPRTLGKIGTIIDLSVYGNVGVDFGEDIGGHSMGGKTRFGYGWYLMADEVELVVPKIVQMGLGLYALEDNKKESEQIG